MRQVDWFLVKRKSQTLQQVSLASAAATSNGDRWIMSFAPTSQLKPLVNLTGVCYGTIKSDNEEIHLGVGFMSPNFNCPQAKSLVWSMISLQPVKRDRSVPRELDQVFNSLILLLKLQELVLKFLLLSIHSLCKTLLPSTAGTAQ